MGRDTTRLLRTREKIFSVSVMQKYLFLLGAPNNESGALSVMASERLDAAASYYRSALQAGIDLRIAVTGGHGSHFNKAPRPHRDYANDELVNRGVPRAILLNEGFLSSNTVEDAILISDFVARQGLSEAAVLTSAFHVERCQLIFGCVLPDCKISFLVANNPPELDPSIVPHERSAIAAVIAQRGIRYGARFFPLPAG